MREGHLWQLGSCCASRRRGSSEGVIRVIDPRRPSTPPLPRPPSPPIQSPPRPRTPTKTPPLTPPGSPTQSPDEAEEEVLPRGPRTPQEEEPDEPESPAKPSLVKLAHSQQASPRTPPTITNATPIPTIQTVSAVLPAATVIPMEPIGDGLLEDDDLYESITPDSSPEHFQAGFPEEAETTPAANMDDDDDNGFETISSEDEPYLSDGDNGMGMASVSLLSLFVMHARLVLCLVRELPFCW